MKPSSLTFLWIYLKVTQFTLGGHLLFDLDACTCTVQFVSVFLITFMLPNCLLPVVKFVMNEN